MALGWADLSEEGGLHGDSSDHFAGLGRVQWARPPIGPERLEQQAGTETNAHRAQDAQAHPDEVRIAPGSTGPDGTLIQRRVDPSVQGLRHELNRLLSGDGIRVGIVQTTSHDLRVYAIRINGTATTRVVHVHLGGAERPGDLVLRVAALIREVFRDH